MIETEILSPGPPILLVNVGLICKPEQASFKSTVRRPIKARLVKRIGIDCLTIMDMPEASSLVMCSVFLLHFWCNFTMVVLIGPLSNSLP